MSKNGLVVDVEGWFVINARESRWRNEGPLGLYCNFEGKRRFPQLGININILEPGQSLGMYHREKRRRISSSSRASAPDHRGAGAPARRLGFVHCPGGTPHIIVGAGEGRPSSLRSARGVAASAAGSSIRLGGRRAAWRQRRARDDKPVRRRTRRSGPSCRGRGSFRTGKDHCRREPIARSRRQSSFPSSSIRTCGRQSPGSSAAYGFVERVRIGEDHRSQLSFGEGAVIIARRAQRAPAASAGRGHAFGGRTCRGVNAHCERARSHGARIIMEPIDFEYGERQYTAEDLAGHRWTFSKTLDDVAPEDWGGTLVTP